MWRKIKNILTYLIFTYDLFVFVWISLNAVFKETQYA